jgi:hypothetical protein
MTTGTRWHAIRLIVAYSIIAGVQVTKTFNKKAWTACQCVPLGLWCSQDHRPPHRSLLGGSNDVSEMWRNPVDRTSGRAPLVLRRLCPLVDDPNEERGP